MSLGDEEPWLKKFWQHFRRILPRVAIIGVAFVGLNWWVNSQKQAQTTAAAKPATIASAWDADQPREPGVAIAILLDEHQPPAISDEAFEKWRENARQFITEYHSQIVKIAGEHDHLKVRVGLYHISQGPGSLSFTQPLSPPSQDDLEKQLAGNRLSRHHADVESALREAIADLSQSRMASTFILIVRHPQSEKQESVSSIMTREQMATDDPLPQPPDGPQWVSLSVLHDLETGPPSELTQRILLQRTFPMLEINVNPMKPPTSSDR